MYEKEYWNEKKKHFSHAILFSCRNGKVMKWDVAIDRLDTSLKYIKGITDTFIDVTFRLELFLHKPKNYQT